MPDRDLTAAQRDALADLLARLDLTRTVWGAVVDAPKDGGPALVQPLEHRLTLEHGMHVAVPYGAPLVIGQQGEVVRDPFG